MLKHSLVLLGFLFGCVVKAQIVGVKTNLPYGLGAYTPNLGAEFGLAPKLTLDVVGAVNPFQVNESKKWKHWNANVELRYWLCDKFNGHFFGVHGFAGQYNVAGVKPYGFGEGKGFSFGLPGYGLFEKENRVQGWATGAGLSYGYQWILAKHWNLEATLGAGYTYYKYDKFNCASCGSRVGSGKYRSWGITRFGLSLIYLF